MTELFWSVRRITRVNILIATTLILLQLVEPSSLQFRFKQYFSEFDHRRDLFQGLSAQFDLDPTQTIEFHLNDKSQTKNLRYSAQILQIYALCKRRLHGRDAIAGGSATFMEIELLPNGSGTKLIFGQTGSLHSHFDPAGSELALSLFRNCARSF